ncbi:MAG: ATP-binding protein [Methylococcales bacterium]|nr:PAS domain S-box protein [Methylococcaceae bacterium]
MHKKRWHILLIDDNPDDRADLRQMLLRGAARRYRFTEVELGAEGLRTIFEMQDDPFDCVLLDYYLPDMNAIDVLTALRNSSNFVSCPVIVVTGSDFEDGQKLLQAGAQDYISKNWISPQALTRAVENAIDRYALQVDFAAAKKLLRLSEQLHSLSFELAPTGISYVGLDGRFVKVNSKMCQITGYSPDELLKMVVSDLTHPDDLMHDCELLTAFRCSSMLNYENKKRYIRKDGSIRWVDVKACMVSDSEGRAIHSIDISQDITDQKYAELNSIKAQSAAESANLAKSEFLSRMSHELRTPLNSILGYAQLLEVGSPALTDTQHERIKPIIKAGWYLLKLIEEILDLSVIESGKIPLSMESLLLIDMMSECQSMVETLAVKRGIRMNFIHFDNTWLVYADRVRLKQVMLNLLSNAVKYNSVHGVVKVSCTRDSKHLCISIKDNGFGLSPEKLAQLFQQFNRLGQETGSEQGTGIGLVVSKQLVELMGGNMSVTSTVGLGSEFCITFRHPMGAI